MIPLTREDIEQTKQKAHDRISEWVQNVKSAGITRLQDRYGEVFRRIEWVREEEVPQKKTRTPAKQKNEKLIKQNAKTTPDKKRVDGRYVYKYGQHTPSPDKMDLIDSRRTPERSKSRQREESRCKSRQTPELRSRSRQTPESRKLYHDGTSTVCGDHRRNIGSHNRSSRGRATSICSIDAISLLCDDETETNIIPPVQNVLDKIKKSRKIGRECSGLEFLRKSKGSVPRISHKRVGFQDSVHTLSHKESNETLYESLADVSPGQRGSLYPYGGRRKSVFERVDHNFVSRLQEYTKPRKRRGTMIPTDDDTEGPSFLVIDENTDSHEGLTLSTQTYPTFNLSTDESFTDRLSDSNEISPRIHVQTSVPSPSPTTKFTGKIPMMLDVDTGLGMRTNSSLLIGSTQSRCKLARPVSATKVNRIGSFVILPTFATRIKSARHRKHASNKPNGNTVAKPVIVATEAVRTQSREKKLKRYIRKIICVLHLLHVTRDKVKIDLLAERLHNKSKEKPTPTKAHLAFDPTYFKAATTTYGGLSCRARDALWKQPGHRTEEDVRTLMEVMYRLPFFTKYSRSVKEELARVMWYDEFENGRVIIKQGDIGSRMYFVVSGSAAVQRTEIDPRTNEKLIVTLYDVHAGSTFGELALIRNIHRTNTVICKGESEFLSLSKEEFNSVLRRDYVEMWKTRYDFFRNSQYFEKLSDEQIKQCADMSEIKEYSNNNVIVGNKSKIGQHVFFLKSGKCEIVKEVEIVRSQSPYLRPTLLLPNSSMLDIDSFLDKPYGKRLRNVRTEKHFLTILTLFPGDYFGIGENLRDMYIISKGKVRCVQLNATIFSLNWSENLKMKEKRESQIPSNLELYRRFEANRRWMEYKKNVVEGIVKRRTKPHITKLQDVPQAIKNEPRIPLDLL